MPSLRDEFSPEFGIVSARQVAFTLAQISSEKRGDFLLDVALALDSDTQFYTASLIRSIGVKYNNGELP